MKGRPTTDATKALIALNALVALFAVGALILSLTNLSHQIDQNQNSITAINSERIHSRYDTCELLKTVLDATATLSPAPKRAAARIQIKVFLADVGLSNCTVYAHHVTK
jgi:hypothetical protein